MIQNYSHFIHIFKWLQATLYGFLAHTFLMWVLVCSIYLPGQNKRHILFLQLSFSVWLNLSHIYITDASLIAWLILKVSAVYNEFSLRKLKICVMYSCSSGTIICYFADFFIISYFIWSSRWQLVSFDTWLYWETS